jgi:glycosyltransferase involved in cell wall biosynthesis
MNLPNHSKNSIRAALVLNQFTGWGGAIDFMRFALEGLTEDEKLFHEVCLLIRRHSLSKSIKLAIKHQTIRPWAVINPHRLIEDVGSGANRIRISYFAKTKLEEAVAKLGINLIMPSTVSLGVDFPIPWTGILFDFQHKYYPELFSEEVLNWRERSFSIILNEAPLVIVNSQSVAFDVKRFFPKYSKKVFSLPFAPLLRPAWLTYDTKAVQKKYGINDKYFIICNQFWVHKDHETAFVAMRSLLDSVPSKDIDLVCTGALEDYRRPDYIPYLKKRLDELRISDRVRLLGHIPKREQISLLRGACAVLQPTLFEGDPAAGSGYEAVALGVRLIASNIPVNLEISGESNVFFFEARDSDQLSNHMRDALEYQSNASDEELLQKSSARRTRLCVALYEAAQVAMYNFNVGCQIDDAVHSN